MKEKNKRSLNGAVALKILLLVGFAAFYLRAILTGTADKYVHPRVIPYLIFAAGVMLVVAVLLLKELLRPRGKKESVWPLLFFALPLLMAFAVPPQSFHSSTGAAGVVQLTGESAASSDTVQPAQSTQGQGGAASGGAGGTAEDGGFLQNGVIVMSSGNFYSCLNELYAHLDQYKGKPIQVEGFVFKDNGGFAKDEFVPARLMMVCCAADMEPIGLLCRYDKTPQLKADSWVDVTGTVGEAEFEGKTVPCIAVQSVEPAQNPDEAYVYPY